LTTRPATPKKIASSKPPITSALLLKGLGLELFAVYCDLIEPRLSPQQPKN